MSDLKSDATRLVGMVEYQRVVEHILNEAELDVLATSPTEVEQLVIAHHRYTAIRELIDRIDSMTKGF